MLNISSVIKSLTKLQVKIPKCYISRVHCGPVNLSGFVQQWLNVKHIHACLHIFVQELLLMQRCMKSVHMISQHPCLNAQLNIIKYDALIHKYAGSLILRKLNWSPGENYTRLCYSWFYLLKVNMKRGEFSPLSLPCHSVFNRLLSY